MSNKKSTVAILTTFQELNPGYSLTGIVVDQVHMLARHGHRVLLYVNENFNDHLNEDSGLNQIRRRYPEQVSIRRKTLAMDLIDYQDDKLTYDHIITSTLCGETFAEDFILYNVDMVFTHDLVFTGWNLPYYHALIRAHELLKDSTDIYWYHWIHSVPVPQFRKEWWTLSPFDFHHYLVFPNKTETMRVAESWRVGPERVKTIPHIKDMRTWYDFGDDAMALIDDCPNLMQAQLIQVYPCSSDRLSAKQLEVVIRIFAHFKVTAKIPVFLVIANQWATGKQPKENIKKYKELAISLGLQEEDDFVFTSEMDEKWENGISKRMLRELQLLSNIFIFPTREESFGLVGPEAAFSGALPIVNRSLKMMAEVMTPDAPAFEFGSFQQQHHVTDEDGYYRSIAFAILHRLQNADALLVKNACRIKYNMESLYYHKYLPLVG